MAAGLSETRRDPRSLRTRLALASALFELIQQHEWSAISISLLCKSAGVARSSFYIHFTDLTDLLDTMIAANLESALARRSADQTPFDWLIDHVAANRPLFFRTATSPRGSFVLTRFKTGFSAAISRFYIEQGKALPPADQAFLVGGCFERLAHWAQRWDRTELPEIKRDVRVIEDCLFARLSANQPQAFHTP